MRVMNSTTSGSMNRRIDEDDDRDHRQRCGWVDGWSGEQGQLPAVDDDFLVHTAGSLPNATVVNGGDGIVGDAVLGRRTNQLLIRRTFTRREIQAEI